MRRAIGVILVLLGSLPSASASWPALPVQPARIVPLDQRSTSVSQGTTWRRSPARGRRRCPSTSSTAQGRQHPPRSRHPGRRREGRCRRHRRVLADHGQVRRPTSTAQLVDLSYSDDGGVARPRSGEATNCCATTPPPATSPTPRTGARDPRGPDLQVPVRVREDDLPVVDSGRTGRARSSSRARTRSTAPRSTSSSRPSRPKPSRRSRRRRPVPGRVPTGNVTANEMYSNTRTLWVEPVTGVRHRRQRGGQHWPTRRTATTRSPRRWGPLASTPRRCTRTRPTGGARPARSP